MTRPTDRPKGTETKLKGYSEKLYRESSDYVQEGKAWSLISSVSWSVMSRWNAEAMRRGADDRPQAEGEYRIALGIFEELAVTHPDRINLVAGQSLSHAKIGDAQVAQGNLPAAIDSYQSALALAERVANTDYPEWQEQISVMHSAIGKVQFRQDNLPAALASYQIALSIHERLALVAKHDLTKIEPHAAMRPQRGLAYLHTKIGDTQRALGHLPLALASYQAAREIWEKLNPGITSDQIYLGDALENIGDVQQKQGDLTAALLSYEANIVVRERLVTPDIDVRIEPDARLKQDLIRAQELLVKLKQQFGLQQDPNSLSDGIVQEDVPEAITAPDRGPGPPEAQNLSTAFMDNAAIDLNAAADELGLSKERAFEALKREAAEAARETTARETGKPRPEPATADAATAFNQKLVAVEAEAVARGDGTLLRRVHSYREGRQALKLPKRGGFTTIVDAQAAARLSATFRNLQDRIEEVGLKPLPDDPVVTEARRLKSLFYRQNPPEKRTKTLFRRRQNLAAPMR